MDLLLRVGDSKSRTGGTLDCHFVGRKMKSEKPLRSSSLSRPINTARQAVRALRRGKERPIWLYGCEAIDRPSIHSIRRQCGKVGRRAAIGWRGSPNDAFDVTRLTITLR